MKISGCCINNLGDVRLVLFDMYFLSYFSVQCIQVMSGKNDKELLEAMCHLLTYVSDVVAALKVRQIITNP